MSYVALPFWIEFKLNPNKHTIAVGERWKARRVAIDGNVKAIIAETEKEAREKLLASVKEYINQIVTVNNGAISLSDFQLGFSTREVKDGEFWSGVGLVSYYDFK